MCLVALVSLGQQTTPRWQSPASHELHILFFCKMQIDVEDALEEILITFLAYYACGFCYPPKLEKTLEFIQR